MRLLRRSQFRVTSEDSEELGRDDLGKWLTIEHSGSEPQDVVVAVDSFAAEIRLAGGEAVELTVDSANDRLASLYYDERSPRWAPLTRRGNESPAQYFVGVHRPLRTDEGVMFTISLRRGDGQFLPRPSHVWIEIEPLAERSRKALPKYFYYDGFFAPGVNSRVALLEHTRRTPQTL